MDRPAELRSNRDLYAFVCAMHRRHGESKRSLEEYLSALWQLAGAHREGAALPVALFAELLEAAMVAEVPPYQPEWEQAWQPAGVLAAEAEDHSYEAAQAADEGTWFPGFERVILRKIVDLHELRAAGAFEDELRYFGLDAPRGGRWYNFDPLTFLECATAGSFDAWPAPEAPSRDGDDDEDDAAVDDDTAVDDEREARRRRDEEARATSGRILVPGPVAMLDAAGAIALVDPATLAAPEVLITSVTWDEVRDFLHTGQTYE
jgi:hypothetical protein